MPPWISHFKNQGGVASHVSPVSKLRLLCFQEFSFNDLPALLLLDDWESAGLYKLALQFLL